MPLKPSSFADYDPFDHPPPNWPGKEFYTSQHKVTLRQYTDLRQALERRCGEREIEALLSAHPELLSLTMFLFSTGHHASWIYPKHHLRPSAGNIGGLIPDYIMAGANSDGVRWFILELKGANQRAFARSGKRVHLSTEANKGICQLLNYIDRSSRSQAYLRDELGLKGFREPSGVLMIGTDEESQDEQVAEFKQAWNRMNPRLNIRSYSSLLRQAAQKLRQPND